MNDQGAVGTAPSKLAAIGGHFDDELSNVPLNRYQVLDICRSSVHHPWNKFITIMAWGAQDISAQAQGAFTGEVSGAMLKDFACRYALVGHSERRSLHGESDQLVADKAKAALASGLTPVVCVGESLAERDANQVMAVIQRQLAPVLALGAEAVNKMVLAYEPVWAIGTGRTATPEQAQEVHAAIRAALQAIGAGQVQILYGGSVKAANAASLFVMSDIDGALVGGASLVAEDFLAIAA